jgi:hypothetical protein
MKRIVPAILGALVLSSFWPGQAQTSKCTKETWRQIAELYAQAVCYPDQFPDFVEKSKDKYPPGGQWQICGEQLGNALLNMATPLGDRREIEERAYSVAARAGAPEFGGQVADSMTQSANSPAVMGLYLLVLIKSATEIQAGNTAYFVATDLYQITSQAWKLMAFAMGPEPMEKFRKAIYDVTVVTIADAAQRTIR